MSDIFGIAILSYLAWTLYQDRVKVFDVRTLADNLSLPEKHYVKAVDVFPKGTSKAKFRSFVRAILAEE
tara:strand:+ start:257 stop:463 length:207 start_codon:yes stop_codon:yes gene_type:complete